VRPSISQPPQPITGYPVGLNAAKTCFVDQNGNPCFALGDAPQYISEQLQKSDVELYLSDRASRGINIIWWIVADKIYQSNPPNDAFGNAPFSGGDFVGMSSQTAYWNYVDYVMGRCLAYGITVLFMPAFMGLSATQGYYNDFYGQTTAVIQGYASFIGNRYKVWPNLIYLLGGDADPNNAAEYAALNTFAVELKAADPNHLITLEAARFSDTSTGNTAAPNGGWSSVDAHTIAYGSVQSWLDINWVYQTGPTVVSGAQRCYSQGKPCLLGEDWYEGDDSFTPQQLRGEGYGSVLGGCTLGRLMGNAAIWPFGSANSQDPATITLSPWQGQLASAQSVGQQLMGKLFRSRRHQLLVQDGTSNAVMTVGASNGSVCARDSEGKTIIAYLPSSQTITIDMTKITDSSGFANCNWYNPQTGAVTAIGNIANTGTHNFTSPDSNDWALVIDSAAAGFRTPGT
jgi:Protein of unknown function (DUF4038)/Putative collagen-binding domain of a collagenase